MPDFSEPFVRQRTQQILDIEKAVTALAQVQADAAAWPQLKQALVDDAQPALEEGLAKLRTAHRWPVDLGLVRRAARSVSHLPGITWRDRRALHRRFLNVLIRLWLWRYLILGALILTASVALLVVAGLWLEQHWSDVATFVRSLFNVRLP
jgi:hypothetical protein